MLFDVITFFSCVGLVSFGLWLVWDVGRDLERRQNISERGRCSYTSTLQWVHFGIHKNHQKTPLYPLRVLVYVAAYDLLMICFMSFSFK